MQTKTDFITVLKKKGLKVTKHRNSLLEVLEIENQPLTAEDIFLKLKEKGISINLSSVYRILDTLVDNNLINKYVLGDTNKTFYEINTLKHKHHLVCTSCKKIFPLENCPLSKYESELEDNLDFEITGHKLEIYGICKECRKHKNRDYKNFCNLYFNYE